MQGFITTKDILLHPALIIRGFGARVFLRCLVRASCRTGTVTFLECI
jgi:hypothetical protein